MKSLNEILDESAQAFKCGFSVSEEMYRIIEDLMEEETEETQCREIEGFEGEK